MERRQVTDPEQAEAAGFRGSPTVLVDGREPFANPDAPRLSCRKYRNGGRADRGAERRATGAVLS